MRFIQFSDVHLDSGISSSLGLTEEKRAVLRGDIREAFSRACRIAADCKADIVLLPGDIFDWETCGQHTFDFIRDELSSLAPVPVFIAPGNHDSLRPGSPYLRDNMGKWPPNVHIFSEQEFVSVEVAPGCTVTGIAHAHQGINSRLSNLAPQAPGADLDFVMFHGSRESFRPCEKENVIPFKDEDIISSGFMHAAVGHYHSHAEIRTSDGHIKGAYSGCVQGRGLDETGIKSIIKGEIKDGRVSIERVEVASRRLLEVRVDITGLRDNASLLGKLDAAIDASGAGDVDIICINYAGVLGSGLQPEGKEVESYLGKFFHLYFNSSQVTPDYDLDAIANASDISVSSLFVKRIMELIEDEGDAEKKRSLLDAAYYGLSALDGKKPEPRDVD